MLLKPLWAPDAACQIASSTVREVVSVLKNEPVAAAAALIVTNGDKSNVRFVVPASPSRFCTIPTKMWDDRERERQLVSTAGRRQVKIGLAAAH